MARQPGEQGSGVVSVQGRSSLSSRAGRSFLGRAMAGAPGQETQLPDELPLLFSLSPATKISSWAAASVRSSVGRWACSSVAPGAGSPAGFLPLTPLFHTSCSVLPGSVPEGRGKQAGRPGGYLFPRVEYKLFCNSGKPQAASQGLEKAVGCSWSRDGWRGHARVCGRVWMAARAHSTWTAATSAFQGTPAISSTPPLATSKTSGDVLGGSAANIACQGWLSQQQICQPAN